MRLAKAKGTQHALANAIAWAYFMDHQLINDDEVLADIAAQHGFAREEALGRHARSARAGESSHELAIWAAQQGIQGVPFFVFDDNSRCPARSRRRCSRWRFAR